MCVRLVLIVKVGGEGGGEGGGTTESYTNIGIKRTYTHIHVCKIVNSIE